MLKVVSDLNGNRYQITIDDDLAWLAPYLTVAKRLGVPVWRLDWIKGYYVTSDKMECQEAAIHRDAYSPNKKLTMTILKYHQMWTRKNGRIEVSSYVAADEKHYFEVTLNTLAHELSHLVHWNHSADRFILETKLLKSFAHLAKKRGYTGYDKE